MNPYQSTPSQGHDVTTQQIFAGMLVICYLIILITLVLNMHSIINPQDLASAPAHSSHCESTTTLTL